MEPWKQLISCSCQIKQILFNKLPFRGFTGFNNSILTLLHLCFVYHGHKYSHRSYLLVSKFVKPQVITHLWHVVVDDTTDVRFIEAHTKRHSGHHYSEFPTHEVVLDATAL